MTRPRLLDQFLLVLRNDGLRTALVKVSKWSTYRIRKALGIANHDPIAVRREELSRQIAELFGFTVRYGPMKGLRLVRDSSWGSGDRAAMLLGLYEQEVLHALQDLSTKYTTFIDLGAADGYYGVGVLVNRLFERSYCYEISEAGQAVIRRTAALNQLSDQVTVRGAARRGFYKELSAEELQSSVLLVDIEGGEFDVLDRGAFHAFRNSIIFIELHEWVEAASEKIQRLKEDALQTHHIRTLWTSSRDLSVFEELRMYNDSDRWLICSEGRPRLMSWLRLDPIAA